MEYLHDKLVEYSRAGYYGFHMPGHKRNLSVLPADIPYAIDITEIDGFDDLHHARGIIMEAQDRAAKLYHAEETHYLINGSTVGILSAVLGSTNWGDRIIMARNCHKSVYNAVYLNGLRAVYVYPDKIPGTDICGPVTVSQIASQLCAYPDAKAVVITSPTYEGIVSDIAGIAEKVHEYGIPLIVDEAHGAHFGFHLYFPKNSNDLGADLVIHSLHKTMPSLTQTALLHMNGVIADREKIRRHLHMLQSSSPSYILMSSVDECVRLIQEKQQSLFNAYVDRLIQVRQKLLNLKHLKLFEVPLYDRSKLVISTNNLECNFKKETKKYTGKLLGDELNSKYLIQMEMTLPQYVVGMTSVCDSESGMKRLVHALFEIDSNLAKQNVNEIFHAKRTGDQSTMKNNVLEFSTREINTLTCKKIYVPYADLEGKISTEYAYVYPPGIPLIVPGERVSGETASCLQQYDASGYCIEGTKVKGKIEVLENG